MRPPGPSRPPTLGRGGRRGDELSMHVKPKHARLCVLRSGEGGTHVRTPRPPSPRPPQRPRRGPRAARSPACGEARRLGARCDTRNRKRKAASTPPARERERASARGCTSRLRPLGCLPSAPAEAPPLRPDQSNVERHPGVPGVATQCPNPRRPGPNPDPSPRPSDTRLVERHLHGTQNRGARLNGAVP